MTDNIRVVVVDDIAETRDHISKLLSFETDMEAVSYTHLTLPTILLV